MRKTWFPRTGQDDKRQWPSDREGAKVAPRANDFAWWASIAEGPISSIEPLMKGYNAELGEDLELGVIYLPARARILVSMLCFSAQVANHDGYDIAKCRLERVPAEIRSAT